MIYVNDCYRELLSDEYYHHNPMPLLIFNTKNHETIVNEYLSGVEFTVSGLEEVVNFPERRREAQERVINIAQMMMTKYINSDRKVAHLGVTHGFLVHKFNNSFGG